LTKGTVGKFIQTFDSWTENTSKSQVNSIHHPSFRTVCQGVFIGPLTSLWTYKMTKMPFGLLHWSELLTYITKGEVVISTFFKSNSSIYASWNLALVCAKLLSGLRLQPSCSKLEFCDLAFECEVRTLVAKSIFWLRLLTLVGCFWTSELCFCEAETLGVKFIFASNLCKSVSRTTLFLRSQNFKVRS